ncbi:hypothetical protein FNF31_01515 [Cafeteria roenbergensis]|uniref:PH domain-containing protein n=1 Tax=Cafeteria roenbergensis TaxID=33653 RepID=A0A5A8DMB2_CAFRO|nr:hypothetical protein FNF31_01515 [Cafeteria roenbergensis]
MSASAAAAGGGDTSLKRKRTKHALVDVAAAWEPSREGSALNSAAKALDLERLQALVEDGAHPDARDKTGMAALHQAAVLGSLPMVHLLLRAGASVNPADSFGDTPLHYAAHCGHVGVVAALLEAGADPTIPSLDGQTPLGSALAEGQSAAAQVMADMFPVACGDLIPEAVAREAEAARDAAAVAAANAAMFSSSPSRPVADAAPSPASEAAWELVAGRLGDACLSGDLGRVRAMLAEGARPSGRDAFGFSPLHRAAAAGNVAIIETLVAAGADVNASDNRGCRPVHIAALCGHVDSAHALISAGADGAAASYDGLTPAAAARAEGHGDVVRVLRALGVFVGACRLELEAEAAADAAAAAAAGGKAKKSKGKAGAHGRGGSDADADDGGLARAAEAALVVPFSGSAGPQSPRSGPAAQGQGQAEWVPTSGAELTLTHGIAVEGPLKVKRPSGVFKWASRYALASAAMRALVLWAGDGSSIEGGEVQWLPFAAVVGVVHHAGKKSGRRFDVTLRGGAAPLALLAESAAEASAWVSALRRALVAAQESSSQERIIGGIMPPIGVTALALEAALKAAKKAERLRGEAEATADELQAKLRIASSSSGGWTDSGSSATELSDAERPRHAGPRASTVLEPVTEDEHEPPTAAVSVSGKASGSSVGSGGGSGVGSGSHVSRGSAGSTPAMPSSSGPQPRRPLSTGNTPGGKTSPKSRRPTSRTTTSLALAMGTASFADGSTSSAGSSGASRAGSAASRGKGKTRPPGERMLPWRTNQTGGELSRRLALAAAGSARGAAGGAAGGGASLSGGPGLRSGLITRQRASSKASSGSSVGAAAAVTAALAARARKGPSGPRDAAAIKLQAAARRWLAARVVSGWQRVVDDDGDIFWYHAGSDTSSWYPPGLDPGEPPSDTEVA